MTKKSIDVPGEIEKIQAAKPVILKCSYGMAKKIKKRSHTLAMLDPSLAELIYSITIKPTGTLSDHIILLCNAQGHVVKMINLTEQPKEKPIVIH